jgi:hypothetical protein
MEPLAPTMKKLHIVDHAPGDGHPDLMFWCPACKCGHGVWTSQPNGHTGAVWTFDGNFEAPTISPSILICVKMAVPPVTPENLDEWKLKPWPQTETEKRCHTVISVGIINYCSDCTHELAGKSIPMEEF